MVKKPLNTGDPGLIPGLGRSAGEGNRYCSILAWRIPWTVLSTGSQRVWQDWATFTFTFPHRGNRREARWPCHLAHRGLRDDQAEGPHRSPVPSSFRTWGPSATLWQSVQRTRLPFCRWTDWGAKRWQRALSYSLELAKGIVRSTNHLFLLFFILISASQVLQPHYLNLIGPPPLKSPHPQARLTAARGPKRY